MSRSIETTIRRASCALDGVLRLVASRWTADVLWVLLTRGPTRFGALRRAVPGVSVRVLTARLRALEEAGLVLRTERPTVPPQVTYALTARGLELRDALTALRSLAERWLNSPDDPGRTARHPEID